MNIYLGQKKKKKKKQKENKPKEVLMERRVLGKEKK